MSLHIVIGYDGPGASATPFTVYVGRSGSEAQAAMDASNAVRFERISNPTVVRKANGKHDPSQPCQPSITLPVVEPAVKASLVEASAEDKGSRSKKRQ